jgi:quaternary ammonium compound-resistance protein SugE
MGLLQIASRTIAMGTAYAVWGGIGALGTVLVGILWFGEPLGPARLLLIFGLVVCIAGLRLVGG